MKTALYAFFIICIAFTPGALVFYASRPVSVESDYVRTIEVDDSSKIEQALSNAVNDVTSRKFIVTGINIKKCPSTKTFKISVGGQDRASILMLEP